ncbi:hypothetical protein ACP4OV_013403 [Aristida adscensionis]
MRARLAKIHLHAHRLVSSSSDPAEAERTGRRRGSPPRVVVGMAAATADAGAGGWVNHAAERRSRAYAVLDAADPARGRAVRWCEWALHMYRADGHAGEARALLRDALACGAHPPTVYRAWIAMEEHAGSGAAARPLFEGLRAWYELQGGGGGADEAGFWCRYIAFELRHGGAARARAVAERAVAACPRDAAVHARYAKAELGLGRADRAAAVVERALRVFAAEGDANSREWLMEEVAAYKNSMREGSWRRLRGLFPFCRGGGGGGAGGRWCRTAGGYQRLGVA